MADQVVVDAGLLLAAVLPESTTERARALLAHWRDHGMIVAAPSLLRYEVSAVLRKAVAQKRLKDSEAFSAVEVIGNFPIRFYLDSELIQRAFEFVMRFDNLTANASQYLAVADQLGCPVWTTDKRLFDAVTPELDWVHWLGDPAEQGHDVKRARKSGT